MSIASKWTTMLVLLVFVLLGKHAQVLAEVHEGLALVRGLDAVRRHVGKGQLRKFVSHALSGNLELIGNALLHLSDSGTNLRMLCIV
jgi:hypothetical protein